MGYSVTQLMNIDQIEGGKRQKDYPKKVFYKVIPNGIGCNRQNNVKDKRLNEVKSFAVLVGTDSKFNGKKILAYLNEKTREPEVEGEKVDAYIKENQHNQTMMVQTYRHLRAKKQKGQNVGKANSPLATVPFSQHGIFSTKRVKKNALIESANRYDEQKIPATSLSENLQVKIEAGANSQQVMKPEKSLSTIVQEKYWFLFATTKQNPRMLKFDLIEQEKNIRLISTLRGSFSENELNMASSPVGSPLRKS